MFKSLLWMTAALMLWASPSFAQDENPEKAKAPAEQEQESNVEDDNSPGALLKKHQDEMQATMQEFSKRASAIQKEFADDDDAQEKIMEAFKGLREDMAKSNKAIMAKIMAIAEGVKENEDVALEATIFALTSSEDETIKKTAVDLIVKHHLNNDKLGDSIGQLRGGLPSKATFDLFQQIIDQSESAKVRGMTALAQASFIEQLQQMAPMIMENPQIAETYPDLVAFVKTMEDELVDDAIISRYENLIAEHGDVESGDLTIKDMVARKLKAIKTRAMTAVGKQAPDIEGPDIDGESFKLSDYRGKVVMLDFWGDW